jgi:uncharacterized protein DUF4331
MSRRWGVLGALLVGAGAVLAAALVAALAPGGAVASSHREAPLISADPSVDATDLYAFRSPDRPDTVTIVANYIPFEDPAGGPNYYKFDDSAVYDIKVDNTGDGNEDITYRFTFATRVTNPNTFLYNTNQVTTATDSDLSVRQTYTVTRIQGHTQTVLGSGLPVAPANVGPRSTPGYDGAAGAVVSDLPGGVKAFAGPRDDPFFVDLGSIFDLGGLRPFNPAHLIGLPAAPGVDGVANYNVHSLAIQVPILQLLNGPSPTIGIYTSTSRPRLRMFGAGTTKNEGPLQQVSRLGNPLVNEVLIPLGKKDAWNASDPSGDRQFVKNYTDPELAGIVNLLYASALTPAPTTDRQDLVAVLLTGVPGLNFTGTTQADLLRLNTSVDVNPSPSRLAVLDGDLQGFPNGRRLSDDVTDIELRAVACGYGSILHGLLGLCDLSPNDQIGDGVDANDHPFSSAFPYEAAPNDGYDHTGHR